MDVTAIIAQLQALTTLPDLRVEPHEPVANDAVKTLQAALNTLAFANPRLTVDGHYGPRTAQAVGALRGLYSLGAGAFDGAVKTALAGDLQAGPNSIAVLRGLAAQGGVTPATAPNISLADLASAVDALATASLSGQSPALLSVQIALAFLNYYPATMVGSNDAAAQTAFAQALLAFARTAFSNSTLASASSVDQGELYARLGQALQAAVEAKGGTIPSGNSSGGGGGGVVAVLLHPLTIVGGGGLLLWWGSKYFLKRALFGGLSDGFDSLGDGYGYELDVDDGDDDDDDDGDEDGANERDDGVSGAGDDKYNHYVVSKDGQIHSGWEYREDAQDAAKDYKGAKVSHRSKVSLEAKRDFHSRNGITDKLANFNLGAYEVASSPRGRRRTMKARGAKRIRSKSKSARARV